ncbi:MAG: hypothetical protein H6970_03150 [Gammaproteobacteria bacterium]|nr:hypothetical protein [Gammaproteobacteria bacterium]MCP5424055.1 hypothetical protein [Gammaproteobacteria bacterium]
MDFSQRVRGEPFSPGFPAAAAGRMVVELTQDGVPIYNASNRGFAVIDPTG